MDTAKVETPAHFYVSTRRTSGLVSVRLIPVDIPRDPGTTSIASIGGK